MDESDKTRILPPEERPDGPDSTSPSGKKDSQGRIGTVLAGRYKIVDILGEGAQGAVYVGEHLRIGRRDAIKVLQPALMEDADAVARFTRGASKASHINHPNVCTVYDFGETAEGLPFMASELVDGEELLDLVRREAPLDLERAVSLLEQAAAGLQAAHELDIVHRDLKPANIMLTKGRGGAEVVKVVDFDIAKGVGDGDGEVASGLTQAGWIIGTPQYMSPEQITAAELDQRSDVYSLALIFFEMITGKLPNDIASTRKLMWERVSGELRGLDEVLPDTGFPAGLQRALDRALAKDVDNRTPSTMEFAREVREAIENPDAAPAGATEEEAMDATMAVPVKADEVPPTRAAPGDVEEGAVPSTRVAPEPAATPAKDSRGSKWTSPPALAGYAVAGIAMVALAMNTGLLGSGGIGSLEDPATGPGIEADAGTGGEEGEAADQLAIGEGDEGDATSPDVSDPPARSGETNRTPPAGQRETSDGEPERATTRPEPTGPTVDVAAIRDELDDLTGELLVGSPGTSRLTEIAERTRSLYDNSALPDDVRAQAASLHGGALIEQGSESEGCVWYRRAMNLQPANRAYRTDVASCGG